MSKELIEINEKTSFEKSKRVNFLQKIAEQNTADLELLYKLASLSKIKKTMIKNHPMVKKYL